MPAPDHAISPAGFLLLVLACLVPAHANGLEQAGKSEVVADEKNLARFGTVDVESKVSGIDPARVHVERITIRGNSRVADYVIRRELNIAEGDLYNQVLIDRAERRLKNLDFFKSVKISSEPGSDPDHIVVDVDVEEKSTADFSMHGGYNR